MMILFRHLNVVFSKYLIVQYLDMEEDFHYLAELRQGGCTIVEDSPGGFFFT